MMASLTPGQTVYPQAETFESDNEEMQCIKAGN